MATNHRNTASSLTQEPPLTIARVALYARVSTLNGQDPEMQLRELREYASRRGWTITSEYVDQGVSGSKESRPELNQLMADAHRRKFDAVLVWKIDRFGRSLKHLVNASRGTYRSWPVYDARKLGACRRLASTGRRSGLSGRHSEEIHET